MGVVQKVLDGNKKAARVPIQIFWIEIHIYVRISLIFFTVNVGGCDRMCTDADQLTGITFS